YLRPFIINDLRKTLRAQARATDQNAIDVGLTHQALDVVWFHRATVENPELFSACVRYLFSKSAPDKSMHFLRLFRRRGYSGADGPNRLVSHDDTGQI